MRDLLDRLLAHDAWTTRQLLELCRTLPAGAFEHEFDFAHESLRATFTHVIWNMEAWSDEIAGRPRRVKPAGTPAGRTVDGLLARLDGAALDLTRAATGVRDRGALDEILPDPFEDLPRNRTRGGAILHVITHGMHHRAQILLMMKKLGMAELPEGDLLGWEEQAGPG